MPSCLYRCHMCSAVGCTEIGESTDLAYTSNGKDERPGQRSWVTLEHSRLNTPARVRPALTLGFTFWGLDCMLPVSQDQSSVIIVAYRGYVPLIGSWDKAKVVIAEWQIP